MKKIFLLCCTAAILSGCHSTGKKEPAVKVPNETLIVSSKGKLFNFNLETGKLTWQYVSKEDTLSNQNRFTFDTESVYMPFESGRLVSVQIVSGKVKWNNSYKDAPDEIIEGGISEDGIIITENSERYLGPVFMSKPLRYDDKLYIASAGNPQVFRSRFYVINAKDGTSFSTDNNSTNYNYYQPVENNKNIYLNSAVYLDLHYKEGTSASNGMYEDAPFPDPLYVQMQASGNLLFLGDEKGKFYALAVEEKGLTKGGDITDPKNNFTDRKDIFEWTYQSEKYPRLGDDQTALADDFLIVCKKSDDGNKMALIALDSKSGKEKWMFEPRGMIKNWQLTGQHEITGYTADKIFVIDLKGKTTFEIPVDSSLYPVSNIEINAKKQLIYITGKGIVSVDREKKKMKLMISHTFYPSSSPLNQIKYFNK